MQLQRRCSHRRNGTNSRAKLQIPKHVILIDYRTFLLLLTFSLSFSFFFIIFCVSLLLHMALKMFIATFAEFLLPAVECSFFSAAAL